MKRLGILPALIFGSAVFAQNDGDTSLIARLKAHPTGSEIQDRYENQIAISVSNREASAHAAYMFNSMSATEMKILIIESEMTFSERQTPAMRAELSGAGKTRTVSIGEIIQLRPNTQYELRISAGPFSEPGSVRFAPIVWLGDPTTAMEPVIARVCETPTGRLAFLMEEIPVVGYLLQPTKSNFINRTLFCGTKIREPDRVRCDMTFRTYSETFSCTSDDMNMIVRFDQLKRQASISCRNGVKKYFEDMASDCVEKIVDRRSFY